MNSGESAESVVRMSLNGVEVAAKITGSTAKAILLMAVSAIKDVKQVKGKTSLNKMLKSGKELSIFSLKNGDLEKFMKEAKRYGVLFCAVMDKNDKSSDGLVDIMVRAEDAPKINRIVERFNFATIDQAKLKTELEETGIDNLLRESKAKGIEVKDIDDKMLEDILNAPIQKEKNEIENPSVAKTEKSPLSEPLSENKKRLEGTRVEKPSVRKQLKDIKEEMKQSITGEEKDIDIITKKKSKTKKNNSTNKVNQVRIVPKNRKSKGKERT